jgi:tetratricopeptide (TPR) repeat protein
MDTKTPFLQKVALITFGLLCTVLFLEAGLRVAGFVLVSIQECRNMQSTKQKGAYRILCLGESTTARQYPPFLEEILNQRNIGIQFSAIDKGIVAVATPVILAQLEDNLTKYRPDMVVIMAGFNDRRILIPGAKIKLFQSYKVYKLLRLLYAQLLKKLKSIEKHDSEYAGAHAALGVLFQNSGRLAEAEELFRKSIAVDPRGSDAYIKLGILYQDSGRLAEAEELFRKVITCDPGNSGAYMRLGQVCANRGRPAEAEVLLKKAVELAPRDGEAYLSLGKFYQRKNRLAEAEPLLEKTI